MKNKWDHRFYELADFISRWSKDPRTKVGAVVVDNLNRIVSLGYNGFPIGTRDDDHIYNNRDRKHARVLHAEINAILFAKEDLSGYTIYCNRLPCSQCAAAIIQSGIVRVVCGPATDGEISRRETISLFKEAGIKLEFQR